MPTYTIRDFRANLRAILAQLANGPVCVAGWGKQPVAYLVSAAEWEKLQPSSAQPEARRRVSDSASQADHWQIGASAPGSR